MATSKHRRKGKNRKASGQRIIADQHIQALTVGDDTRLQSVVKLTRGKGGKIIVNDIKRSLKRQEMGKHMDLPLLTVETSDKAKQDVQVLTRTHGLTLNSHR